MTDYWEYRVVSLLSYDTDKPVYIIMVQDEMNRLGQEGWELVGIYDQVGVLLSPYAVFKRPTVYNGEPCDPDALVS